MTETTRSILRLSPVDEQSLLTLIRCTSARSKADVVRRALELMAWMWDLHLRGASFAIHDSRGEVYPIQLGAVVEGGRDDRSATIPSRDRTLQLRLREDHQVILDRLIETGAAPSRSAAVRTAIELYREIVEEMQQTHSLFAVLPEGQSIPCIPVPVPGAMSSTSQKLTAPASGRESIVSEVPQAKPEPSPAADSASPQQTEPVKRKDRGVPPRLV